VGAVANAVVAVRNERATLDVSAAVVADLDADDNVDVLNERLRCAGWAGATRGGAGRGLGEPAPKNRGSLPPILRPSGAPKADRWALAPVRVSASWRIRQVKPKPTRQPTAATEC